ncbi:tudor domain-containing protein qin isoform X3 [Nomia melanderi]|uniref:tudor domain-containing protein qin isoform X3 n=1 Tax=Nomia melanderi TaxID=2448451 RepID=UPI003FCE5E4A
MERAKRDIGSCGEERENRGVTERRTEKERRRGPEPVKCANARVRGGRSEVIHGRALQGHSKIILSNSNNEDALIVQNTCSERCKEPLGYYCENCEIAGCSHCMLRLHKKHNYVSLVNKNTDFLIDFHEMCTCVAQRLQRIHQAQKKLKTVITSPENVENAHSVETAITQHFAFLHGTLQNMERKIIDELHQHRDSWNKNIDDISEQLKELESRLQTALTVIGSVDENLDKIDLQQVIKKLRKLCDIPCHLLINSEPEDMEIRFDIDESIIEALQKHCTIQIPRTSSFSLQRTELLPDDYEMEPLTEEFSIPKHKDRSFAGMKSTSVVTLPSRQTDDYPAAGSSEMVRVTHVVNPSCFYVQLVQNQNKIAELKKGLSLLANTSGIIPTAVTINALYIVQSAKERSWYRGRVINKKTDHSGDEKYTVYFIDYGMEEDNVPLSRMRNIIPQFAMFNVMALRCSLFEIVPNGGQWHPDAIEAFKKLVYTNSMVSMCIMTITGDTYYVDLCAVSSKDAGLIPIKDSLTYMKYATCISRNKLLRMNPYSTKTYVKEELSMETYTNVDILYIDSPKCIYVKKVHACRSHFIKMVREMTETYEQNISLTESIPAIHKDLPCVARGADGLWHRGIINEVTENTVRVFYVDLGYTLTLNYDSVRALSKNFMSCKTQAIKVSLKNIKPINNSTAQWGPEVTKFLEKHLGEPMRCKIMTFDKIGDTYSVLMYTLDESSISNLLITNGFAIDARQSMKRKYKQKRDSKNVEKPIEKEEEIIEKHCEEYSEPFDAMSLMNASMKNSGVLKEKEDPFKVQVLIHQVHSPNCIYVSDAMYEPTDIKQMMDQMQEFYSKYRSAKRDCWNEGAVCAVFLAKNNMYYRGSVVEIKSKDRVLVFLYDMGNEEIVTINDLQSLYPPFLKIPTYVFKIKLAGILPCGGSRKWPSLSCQELCEITKNENCKFYVTKLENDDIQDSAIPVELWIKESKIDGPLSPTRIEINSVNRMLVEKGVALPIKGYAKKRDKILAIELKSQLMKKLERLSKSESNVKWFKINDENDSHSSTSDKTDVKTFLRYSDSDSQEYSSEEILYNIPSLPSLNAWLPAEDILNETFIALPTNLDHNGYLYLHSVEQNEKILLDIETKLQKFYKNSEIEACDTVWAAGNMCIAQYHANKKWYRGKVLKILENDIVEVEFVDYGNVEVCSIGTLKKKVILENIPIQCSKCLIYGLNPGDEHGKWMVEDLDKIHCLLIDKKCEVSILDKTNNVYIISVTIFPNKYCRNKSDLITFLINDWGMNIKPDSEMNISEKESSFTDTADVIIENSDLLYSIDRMEEINEVTLETEEKIKDKLISGYSPLIQDNALNESGSIATTDVENLSWCIVKSNIVSSTPNVVSEENLSVVYKLVNIPKDLQYIEIELCCNISATEFYARLKENAHSVVLSAYYAQYKLLMEDLQENAPKQPVLTDITLNTPCCAKFNDDLWYRCLIIESDTIEDTNDIEIKLLYVDYGNDEYRTVNAQNCELYTLKKEWADVPALAMKCRLWNVDVVPSADETKLLTEIHKMYSKPVVGTIKEIDKEYTSLELYEDTNLKKLLYSSLIEDGLFKIKTNNEQIAFFKNISK